LQNEANFDGGAEALKLPNEANLPPGTANIKFTEQSQFPPLAWTRLWAESSDKSKD
jgi:hypothetical protein